MTITEGRVMSPGEQSQTMGSKKGEVHHPAMGRWLCLPVQFDGQLQAGKNRFHSGGDWPRS
jgi:hypothetical protein